MKLTRLYSALPPRESTTRVLSIRKRNFILTCTVVLVALFSLLMQILDMPLYVQVFPRFFFVSDDSLLSILSNPMSVSSIQPHLISLFGAMDNIVLSGSAGSGEDPEITAVESVGGERLSLITPVRCICMSCYDGGKTQPHNSSKMHMHELL